MAAIILIMLGILFASIDIFVAGMSYPVYEMTTDIGDKIQQYVSGYIASDHLKIDILPDVIGCIFLFVGTCMLLKYTKKFIQAQWFIVFTAALSIAVYAVPFFLNGKEMVVTVLILFFVQIACELYMEFLIIYTIVSISSPPENVATNTRMQFGWWITVFCRVFITFLTFVGHIRAANVYKAVLIPAALFTVYQLLAIRKFVGSTERKHTTWKEKLLK